MYNICKIVRIGYVVAIKTSCHTTSVKSLCFVSAFSCWAIMLCLLHKMVLEVSVLGQVLSHAVIVMYFVFKVIAILTWQNRPSLLLSFFHLISLICFRIMHLLIVVVRCTYSSKWLILLWTSA